MNHCIKTCLTQGIPRLLIKEHRGSKPKFGNLYDYWMLELLRSGKKYSRAQIHRTVSELARENNLRVPGLTTVKEHIEKLMPLVTSDRYGADFDQSQLPYASIRRASASDLQWQCDGWRLPFYMDGFKTLTLFWIMDACSGMIVGYEIGRTENTELILKGFENAVETTGVLPFEILSDNHSFKTTSESDYFEQNLKKVAGTIWKVSSNPRYKSLVERSFKTFGEQYCKEMPGYIGEGIRTKNPDGRTTQELMDKYTKSGGWLTEEQIKLIAIDCVIRYNQTAGKDGKTREQRYQDNKTESTIQVNQLDRLRLFTRAGKYTVRRCQINITREQITHEFQLNANLSSLWNNREVLVRYVDFTEIYLFDPGTDAFIGCVTRKQNINGALADQSEEDKIKFYKLNGRISGIKTTRRKTFEEIAEQAYQADPEAAYSINPKLAPKNLIEKFEECGERRAQAQRMGINLDLVTNFPAVREVNTYDPDKAKKAKRKKAESPFLVEKKELIDLDSLSEY